MKEKAVPDKIRLIMRISLYEKSPGGGYYIGTK